MTAVVIALSLASLASKGSGAAVGQTAVSSSAASVGELERAALERCTSARRAVGFYIRSANRWLRLAFQPLLDVPTSGRSCRQARAAAKRLKREAIRGRLIFALWTATPKLAGETPWHASAANPVNRNLLRLGSCETGGKPGQNGEPDWDHHNSTYSGALGFAHSTWSSRRWRIRPLPPAIAAHASPAEQLAVGRALVREFSGYSSWPSCHLRLGLPG